MSFVISSLPILLLHVFWRPEIIWIVEPPLFCAPQAVLFALLARSASWLHVQDLEVEMAFKLGIIRGYSFCTLALSIEKKILRLFNVVSSISGKMVERLVAKGVDSSKCVLFPNWANTDEIYPLSISSQFRGELGIPEEKIVALYSGSLGEKQGIEIVIQAADHLRENKKIQFVICGDGAARDRLLRLAE